MPLQDIVLGRINELIEESHQLRHGGAEGQCRDEHQMADCAAWRTAALNCVQQLCADEKGAYRKHAEEIAERSSGWNVNHDVGEFGQLLKNLRQDVQAGLLASIADHARAETFDDFLDHARAYIKEGRKNEAGVIAGVVFEDAVRRICGKHAIATHDVNLDSLISALAKIGILSGTKAKRARAAAHVRTKATHADWGDFDLSDAFETIQISEDLIAKELEA
jgi:hypothetical protein